MAADNDLFTALQMFQRGVKDLSLARTLESANEQVMQIKATEASEQQKRAQMQDLSNQLVRQLGAQGVEPMKIAQQAQAITPMFQTPAQAAIQGTLMGDASLVEAAKEADIAGQAGNIAQLKVQQEGADKLQDKKFAQALALQAGKTQKKTQGDVDFSSNVQSALVNLQQLEKTVKKSGNFEFWDAKSKAVLNQAAYDLAISYAKIVDPATAAREGEVAAAQKYLIPMGLGTRNSLTLASIKEYKKKLLERVKARQNAKREGVVDPFDQYFGDGGVSQATSPNDKAAAAGSESDDISKFILG